MTRFRPCIDLHAGQVKQIVGGTLTEKDSDLKTNYVSKHSAGYYANLYKDTNCLGAHVIMLGPGNEDAAKEALAAWPSKLQVGGGITDKNAKQWIDAGAEKVCHRPAETLSQKRKEGKLMYGRSLSHPSSSQKASLHSKDYSLYCMRWTMTSPS